MLSTMTTRSRTPTLMSRWQQLAGRALSTSTTGNRAFIHEVTPRDGLQNEKTILTLDEKLTVIEKIARAKPDSIEVASFVRPDLVPAMADGFDLCVALGQQPWATEIPHYAALVPNLRGFETYLKARDLMPRREQGGHMLNTVVCLVSCTDSHSKANVGRPMAQALDGTLSLIRSAQEEGVQSIVAYASLAFGCPFEGSVDEEKVMDIVRAYQETGATKIILADTLGCATPEQVEALVDKVAGEIPLEKLGLHMHGAQAPGNIAVAVDRGVRRFDAATGGCGGCNFIPNAKGNVATEDVLAVLNNKGIVHGVDLGVVEHDVEPYLRRVLKW